MEKIRQMILKLKLSIKRIRTNQYKSDVFTKQAEGNFLTRFASMHPIARKYYGDRKKPEPFTKDCYYDSDNFIPGWYENDESLRRRILDQIKDRQDG